eukprot:TRINITY_DN1285_c0_g1_i1.p1 TRINITY_DN1285_c0_g1~~TRINITY_DN1285_c0_g1_i1.p1  ORF type:complete len:486 (-),score=104.37 TRINITY_DN1285_c0_g1_i1:165-1622(-)
MDQIHANEFVDVESMSENEQALLSEARPRSRWMSLSRAALLSSLLIGLVIACVFTANMGRGASKTRISRAIGLSSDDDLSSLFSDDAEKQVDAEMEDLGGTTEAAPTSEASEEPTEEPMGETTDKPTEEPTAERTEEPKDAPTEDEVLDALGGSTTREATTGEEATEAPSVETATEAPEFETEATTEAPTPTIETTAEVLTTVIPTIPASTSAEVLTTVIPTIPAASPIPSAATEAAPAAVAVPPIQPGLSSSNLQNIALQLQQEASGLDKNSDKYKQLMNISKMLSTVPATAASQAPATAAAAAAVAAAESAATTMSPIHSELAPKMSIGDGNPCPDDEESSAGLCFKKCSDLTGGTHPIRTSAFSCCRAKPCSISNTQTHMGMCWGFDVAADSQSSKCPQPPGACLTDEDSFDDMCYKKCSDLTNGAYPHRVAAATCCKTTGWGCWLLSNLKTDTLFTQGGGAGDGNSGTPAEGHPPFVALTR